MARAEFDTSWMHHLPMVLLGIRTAWRTDLDCSPSELVYWTTLTVPGLLVGDSPRRTSSSSVKKKPEL